MKLFRKKSIDPNSGPGWSAYIESPEDFAEVAWQEEIQRHIDEMTTGNRVKHFFTYCLYKVKYRFMRNNPVDEYSGGFGDDEIHVRRMCDIYDENRIKFEEFAEEVLDKGIASIAHEGKLVIFQREDLPRNPGIALFSENLDGTNRFKDGWMSNSGTREQQVSSIVLQLAGRAASIEGY